MALVVDYLIGCLDRYGAVSALALLAIYFYILPAAVILSPFLAVAATVFVAATVAYAGLQLVHRKAPKGRLALRALLLVAFAAFACMAIATWAFAPAVDAALARFSVDVIVAAIIIMMPLLAVSLALFSARKRAFGRASMLVAVVFVAAAIGMTAFAVALNWHGIASDEQFIGTSALQAMLSGHNPYTMSFAAGELAALRANETSGVTLSAGNTASGTLIYPALYPMALLPSYLAMQLAGMDAGSAVGVSIALYLLVLVFAFAWSKRAEDLARPDFAALAFMAIFISMIVSAVWPLMLAVLLIAYAKIDSGYLFIPLGVAAALQQILWLPVLLFIVYAFNNGGFRRGSLALGGTLLIFLMVNGYFFLGGGPNPLSNGLGALTHSDVMMLPGYSGTFAYLLSLFYPVPLGSFEVLFLAAVIGVIAVLLYRNDKRLIGLLSLVPFLFMYRDLPVYYSMFICFFVLSLSITGRRMAARGSLFSRATGKSGRYIAAGVLAVLAVGGGMYVYAAHSAYTAAFDVAVGNVTLSRVSGGLVYSGTLSYDLPSRANLSFMAFDSEGGMYGLFNQTILYVHSVNASAGTGLYELNRNVLDADGRGDISFSLKTNNSNATLVVCGIYYGDYYYQCPVAAFGAT